MDELLDLKHIAFDFDGTLVGDRVSDLLSEFIRDHPDKTYSIITFRTPEQAESIPHELDAVGLTVQQFDRIVPMPLKLAIDWSHDETIRRNAGMPPVTEVAEGALLPGEYKLVHWKGFVAHKLRAEALVDDMPTLAAPGCRKYHVKLIDAKKLAMSLSEGELLERYTSANSHLLQYLKNGEFDPYTYWGELNIWFEENPDYIELLSEITGQPFEDADAINEEEPDLFYRLPKEVQDEAAEWVIGYLNQHAPHEAPTYTQVGLRQKHLLPRTTWLVHFTDQPDKIAAEGFRIGVHDINKLGLTTFFSNQSFEKEFGGYNFAFLADSQHANWAAGTHKYGKHAVMFQNSGVLTDHYADQEKQVIFHGEDVDPRDIVVLRNYGYDEWRVQSQRATRRDEALFVGDFEKCVAWVEHNYRQYRRYLTGR